MFSTLASLATIDHAIAVAVGAVGSPLIVWVKNEIARAIAEGKALKADVAALKARAEADLAAAQKMVPPSPAAPAAPAHIGG